MADPMTSLFGKRAFRGTGRTEDYFPEAPDLAFLDRPTFIAPGAGYNPKLDAASLVSAGFSPRNAMVLQDMRRQFHEQAQMEREAADASRAMNSLSRLDPSQKGFSKELLNIFRSSPNAIHNPEVRQTAEFISRFANQKPEWSIENIEDPDIYQQAVNEKWDVLTPAEARRRANSALTQRSIRGELAALGMTKEDLDKNKAWSQEDYLREKGRLLRESKAAPREALGSSELAKFNEALTGYNDALAGVDAAATEDAKRDAFKTATGKDPVSEKDWQDAYNLVKQNTVAAPRQALQQMVDLYQGRNIPEVVLRALGVSGQPNAAGVPAPAAPAWPTEAPTTFGPGQAPMAVPVPSVSPATSTVPAPVPAVSPADLKRVDAAPVSFESLSEQVANQGASQRKAREDEFLARQKSKEDESGLWETAKQQILQRVTPQDLEITEADFSEQSVRNPYALLSRLGKKETDAAFSTKDGKKVPWSDVLAALVSDPRWKQAASGGSVTAPARKSFSSLWGGK